MDFFTKGFASWNLFVMVDGRCEESLVERAISTKDLLTRIAILVEKGEEFHVSPSAHHVGEAHKDEDQNYMFWTFGLNLR